MAQRWTTILKPKAEEDVLITFIYHRDKKPHVCIARYFPLGYIIDWNPTLDDERECEFIKEIDDGWIFTKEMWMESYFHCDEIEGVWLEDDEVTAWKPLPKPCMIGVDKLMNLGDVKKVGETE